MSLHNRPRRLVRSSILLPALVMAASASANAQGVNYGAFEQLFSEPVTASATGKPQRASDVPVAMDIITAEQIRRSGAHDIPQVLARYTSLDVQQFGAQDYSVGIRGYATPSSARVLVLLNGRQVYLDDFGQTIWAAVPVQLSEIRQIEVVKGPNSALFGYNAAAGVINIVTYSPLHDRGSSGTVRLGSNGYREASGAVSVPVSDRGGLRLSAGLREQHPWNHGFDAIDTQFGGRTTPSRVSFAADSLVRITDNLHAGVDASYARILGSELMTTGFMPGWDRTVWSVRGRISADTAYGLVEASAYRNAEATGIPRLGLLGNQSVTVLQLSDTVKLGSNHTLRPFGEYRYNEGRIAASGIDFTVGTVGLMWNWLPADGFETTAAVRYDRLWQDASGYGASSLPSPFPSSSYQRDYSTLAWNLGAVWKPGPLDAARLSVARGISTPALIQLGPPATLPILPLGIGITGSPTLQPTIVDSYELGYKRKIDAIAGRIDASVFYQVNRALNSGIALVPAIFPPAAALPTSIPINIGNSHAYGVELSGTGQIGHGFDWDLRYRLVVTDADLLQVPLEYKHASPRHLLVSRLGWAQGPWEADLFGRYTTRMEGWRATAAGYTLAQVEDVVSLSGRVAYRVTQNVTLALEGSNILQERQRQSIGAEAERRVFLSLRTDF